MKLFVIATKENKMHIKRENIKAMATLTQVTNVVYGPLVISYFNYLYMN
jgi:hypothetical protein